MNEVDATIGLRDVPLSHYLLRGERPDTDSQLNQLRRLQEQQSAITPLQRGPFRLFVSQRKMLHDVRLDKRSLLEELNRGIEVIRVEPDADSPTGKLVGLINCGRVRIVLVHEPDVPAPMDWQLIDVYKGAPSTDVLATMSASWEIESDVVADCDSDAATVISHLFALQNKYDEWQNSWKPQIVNAGSLILHASRRLRDSSNIEHILTGLFDGNVEVYVIADPNDVSHFQRGITLSVACDPRCLFLVPAKFDNAEEWEWLLHGVGEFSSNHVIAQLKARWLRPSNNTVSCPEVIQRESWLSQLRHAATEYCNWNREPWKPSVLHGGAFRLRVSHRVREKLDNLDLKCEKLCEVMSSELKIFRLSGSASDLMVARSTESDITLQLTPYVPAIGESDWKLIHIRNANRSDRPYAQVLAEWQEGRPGRWNQRDAGDASGLIRELMVLEEARKERTKAIITAVERLAGTPVDLARRISDWQCVCELERDLLQVGVTRLESSGSDYLLTPEEQETVEAWIEGIEAINTEGVNWSRYPLKLSVDEKWALLTLQESPSTDPESKEFTLLLACDNYQGRDLLDQLCDRSDEDSTGPDETKLFLPDSQLRLIDDALLLLNPNEGSRSQRRGLLGRDLNPDDQTLRTLQRILSEPQRLEPLDGAWPELPVPPLMELSQAQELAVRAAIFGPDMTLIQGPPGTGKTTVILEILRQLFRRHGKNLNFKVLLVAPTHVAVDNVLERLVTPRKGGANLIMELGVAPYRVGSTRRIGDHLRGFTPDCFNSEYRQRTEKDVDVAATKAVADAKIDQAMLAALESVLTADSLRWIDALQDGKPLEEPENIAWPTELEEDWKDELSSQEGRMRAWKHWHSKGARPEERASLLERWLGFLQTNPRFFSDLLLNNANLVCATTIGCATHRGLRDATYDYVIVDEAGKEEARRLLVPLIRGERWILVGDHQQLPPYADDSLKSGLQQKGLNPEILTRSLFEELQAPFASRGSYVFLDQQGRMHPDISLFVSFAFYDGKLKDFPHASSHSASVPSFLPDTPHLLVLDTSLLADRFEKSPRKGQYHNQLERDLILLILRDFFDGSYVIDDPSSLLETVGIIAPYRRQVEEINKAIRRDSRLKRLLWDGVIQVGTVDSFQGQEKDFILFSCTRSNPGGRVGFVDNRQRLNVALSRARGRLIVLLDSRTVEKAVQSGQLSEAEALNRDQLHKLVQFAKASGGFVAVPPNWRKEWRSDQ